jgi:hypothetical protein
MMYEGDPPVGNLSLVFRSSPIIHIPGPWKLEWKPEDASSMSLPTPTEAPQASNSRYELVWVNFSQRSK